MKLQHLALASIMAASIAAVAQAATQTFTVTFQEGMNGYYGTLDTYLNEDDPNKSYGSSDKIEVDGMVSTFNTDDLQGLIRFTNIFGTGTVYEGTSSLNYIPTNATISGATLTLVNLDSGNSIDIKRMANYWDESSTWNTVNRTTIATDGSWDGSTGTKNFTVTSALQSWLADPSINFGWLLTMGGSNGAQVASSENGTVSNRPLLSVTFTVDLVNLAPTLTSITGNQNVRAGQAFTVSASATDPGNDSLTYRWDLNNDGVYGDLNGANIIWAFNRAGNYQAKVEISDGEGGYTYGSTNVHVKNQMAISGTGSNPLAVLNDSSVVDISDVGIGTIAVKSNSDINSNNPLVLALWLSGDESDWQTIKDELAADGVTVLLSGDNDVLWNGIAASFSDDMFDMLVVLNSTPEGMIDNTVYYNFNFAVDVQKVAAVPEVASLGMLALGAGSMLLARRRRVSGK